jgi:predicted PurR-regulated permease PerM
VSGWEKLVLDVFVFAVTAAWILGITYLAWSMFEKHIVAGVRSHVAAPVVRRARRRRF